MYDDLIKKLRHCGNAISCLHCPYWEGCGGSKEDLMQSADAIEELCGLCASQSKDCSEANELHGAFESATEAEKTIAYQRGLEDAWVAAKRVFAEMDYDECIECFGEEFSEDNLTMFDRFSATDVIQMLKKYDDKKAKEKIIRFGDEVEAWDLNSWVQFIAIGDEGDGWMVGFDRGGGSYRYPVESCRKTGRRWKVIEDGE